MPLASEHSPTPNDAIKSEAVPTGVSTKHAIRLTDKSFRGRPCEISSKTRIGGRSRANSRIMKTNIASCFHLPAKENKRKRWWPFCVLTSWICSTLGSRVARPRPHHFRPPLRGQQRQLRTPPPPPIYQPPAVHYIRHAHVHNILPYQLCSTCNQCCSMSEWPLATRHSLLTHFACSHGNWRRPYFEGAGKVGNRVGCEILYAGTDVRWVVLTFEIGLLQNETCKKLTNSQNHSCSSWRREGV